MTSKMENIHYRGRDFSPTDMDVIRGIIAQSDLYPTRTAIARAVCLALGWVSPGGQPKVDASGAALRGMHRNGIIELPGRARGIRRASSQDFSPSSDPGPPVTGLRGDLKALHLRLVSSLAERRLWRELIARYHYLGYKPLIGAQMRYLIYDGERLLGALGFASAAWQLAARDRFIGWTSDGRKARLHLVVNNSRYPNLFKIQTFLINS